MVWSDFGILFIFTGSQWTKCSEGAMFMNEKLSRELKKSENYCNSAAQYKNSKFDS